MPKVLTQLKIDEISAVDRAAGEGCEIIFSKRDPDFYHKLFAGRNVRRVVRHPRRLRHGDQLRDIADAKNALLHSPMVAR